MIVRSWTRSFDDWAGLGPWADGALVMAERAEDVVLARASDLPEGEWYRGHCFTADWHLRWRQMGERVRLVGLGPVPPQEDSPQEDSLQEDWPEPEAKRSLEDYDRTPRSLTLWGKRRPGEAMWLELRIPNVMAPPSQHPEEHRPGETDDLLRRVLQVVTYEAPGGEDEVFHRYLGLGYAQSDDEETTYDVLGHPATS